MPLKWIPRSKSGASKSQPRWSAHTRIGNVWEYPPPGSKPTASYIYKLSLRTVLNEISEFIIAGNIIIMQKGISVTHAIWFVFCELIYQ